MHSLLESDLTFQRVLRSEFARQVSRVAGLPLYYHLITSGVGAFIGDKAVGWMYVHGRSQVLYVQAIAVDAEFRGQGIGTSLLRYAEDQARALSRRWLGLRVTHTNAPAIRLYERFGFRRGHWRLWRGAGPAFNGDGLPFRRVHGAGIGANFRAFSRFWTIQDAAGEHWLSECLIDEQYGLAHQHWVSLKAGRPGGYANLRAGAVGSLIYLAPGMDGPLEPFIETALEVTLGGRTADPIVIRLAGASLHDESAGWFEGHGFQEGPADTYLMFKAVTPVSGQESLPVSLFTL
jgi:GNAT superfamily N-acetyltransferase